VSLSNTVDEAVRRKVNRNRALGSAPEAHLIVSTHAGREYGDEPLGILSQACVFVS
jgi:hypothetical protein